jgi:hypothetical protein
MIRPFAVERADARSLAHQGTPDLSEITMAAPEPFDPLFAHYQAAWLIYQRLHPDPGDYAQTYQCAPDNRTDSPLRAASRKVAHAREAWLYSPTDVTVLITSAGEAEPAPDPIQERPRAGTHQDLRH